MKRVTFAEEIRQLVTMVDTIPSTFNHREYDPVSVATSSYLGLPIQMATSANYSYVRRRRSLIEAVNNSIQDDIWTEETSAWSSEDNSSQDEINMAGSNYLQNERIFSIKQILNRNDDTLDRGRMSMRVPRINVRYSGDEEVHQPPVRIYRSKTQKRSQSHPHYHNTSSQGSDEDCESDTCQNCFEDNSNNFKRSCRCSMQSTCSSFASRSVSTVSTSGENGAMIAEAIWDHVAVLPDELPFSAGDIINVLDSTPQSALWYGICRDSQGWFPAAHVKLLTNNNNTQKECQTDAQDFPPMMKRYRANVVDELLHTEREYVRLLEDIVFGFLEQTRRRSEMFSPNLVKNVFGNVQAIYTIQCKLLRDLEVAYDQSAPENTCIGLAFLKNKHAFSIYSDYCNNRPLSVIELEQLSRHPMFRNFFEACRLLRGMPNLSLEAFLLTPVQRICRYPLHLTELLKATPTSHPDYTALQAAEKAMREVASQVNDRKRKIEALQEVFKWQQGVHNWKGPNLIENNSALLRSGQVYCRCHSINGNHWSKEVVMFLFDQSIVMCKKDVLKKNGFVFKDRLTLTNSRVVDVPDGKDPTFSTTVKNSFKVLTESKQFMVTCSDKKSKSLWLSAFTMRQSMSYCATAEEKRLAIATLNAANLQ